MRFERMPVAQSEGAILAGSLEVLGRKWKKGRVLSRFDVEILQDQSVETVVVAKLDEKDVDEDRAAEAIARVIAGKGVELRPAATGRCNLYAKQRGLLWLRDDRIHQINMVDEAFTVATLPSYSSVYVGRLLVSVKVIPFAVGRDLLDDCITVAKHGLPPINVLAYQQLSIGLIQTRTEGFKSSLLEKGERMLRNRAEQFGSDIKFSDVCDHHEKQVAKLVGAYADKDLDLILLLGASAIQDRNDVIPKGIIDAGGRIEHFGIPVDPGNLLLMAKLGKTKVLGLPGCVRSPKRNGFDFVFERLAAGLEILPEDVMKMGIGGILTEPSRRPERRTVVTSHPESGMKKVVAIVLAAGESTRMGNDNKLLLDVGGRSVIAQVVQNLVKSKVNRVLIVTGHESEQVRSELATYDVSFVQNPEFFSGLSTSLRTALAEVQQEYDGALICLGDMPFVKSEDVNALIDAFDPVVEHNICVPTYCNKRGNPVLWDKRYFQEMMEVRGDVGAKHIIGDYEEYVIEVEMKEQGVVMDLDTPAAYSQWLVEKHAIDKK